MTAKRFELKIPLDLLEKIEDAARDYFQSPLNHTSKKPELTSPILKLIEKGLEKIASSPDTDRNQIDTNKLSTLIDEKIKAHLSVYNLDAIQTAINNLEQVVFSSGNRLDKPVYNPDINEIVTSDDIPDSRGNGELVLFSVELDQTVTVDVTDTKLHQVQLHHGEGEDKGDKGDKKVLNSPDSSKSPNSSMSEVSEDSSKSIDLSRVNSTQIEPVLSPDKSETRAPESMDNHNTHEKNSTDSIQSVSVNGVPNDEPKATEDASIVGTVSVSSPDTPSNDTTLMDGGLEKSFAPGAKITLKGAWKHALLIGFTGTQAEFRSLFSRAGDVHYGVKLVYKSNAGSSRNYEILGV